MPPLRGNYLYYSPGTFALLRSPRRKVPYLKQRIKGVDLLELAEMRTGSDSESRTAWLAEAAAEYRRLSVALTTLRLQLEALGVTIGAPDDPQIAAQVMRIVGAPSPPPAPAPPQPHEATVKVNMLGPFQMEVAGQRFGPGVPGQVRTTLEYLVSNGRRPVPRDVLIDLLWPNVDPAVANGRLRVVMHALRKSIPHKKLGVEELIVTSGNNFVFNPHVKVQVDVVEFERRWQSGWRMQRAGRTAEAILEYEEAESLYVGDFLEDEPYADWTLLRREALRDAYASILTSLATMSLEAHDYTGCIIWAQKLLAQDDCREDAYRLLITSHRHLGQKSRADYWYGHCARTLERELGMVPSPETEAAYRSTY